MREGTQILSVERGQPILFRAFILKASEGRTAPDFSLKSLAGTGGRMDLICRCIVAALHTAGGVNREAKIAVVLEGPPDPPLTITFDGSMMEKAPAGEVTAAELIMWAIARKEGIMGISAERKDFERIVSEYRDAGFDLYYLHEEGEDSLKMSFWEKPAFILGDQKGLDPKSERFLDQMKAKRVSLGPHSYLASHCITLVSAQLQ